MPAPYVRNLLFACVLLPQTAFANPYAEAAVEELRDHGYEQIEVSRTLLGRYRVVGTTSGSVREIIVYGGTGAVVRDYQFDVEDDFEGDEPSGASSEDDDWNDDPETEVISDDEFDDTVEMTDESGDEDWDTEFDEDDDYPDEDYDADEDIADEGSDW